MQINPERTDRIVDYTSVTGITFVKSGGAVTAYIYGYKTSGNAVQFVIPADFRPTYQCLAVVLNNTDKVFSYADISPNGNVYLRLANSTNLAADKYIYGLFTYIL